MGAGVKVGCLFRAERLRFIFGPLSETGALFVYESEERTDADRTDPGARSFE